MKLFSVITFLIVGVYSVSSYSETNPGYKDLQIGESMSVVNDHCEREVAVYGPTRYWYCYGIKGLTFMFVTQTTDKFLVYTNTPNLKKSPIDIIDVNIGEQHGQNVNLILLNPESQYNKLRKSLGEKYKTDFEFSDRDKELFNTGKLDKLVNSYQQGQVILMLFENRIGGVRLQVSYQNSQLGREFIEKNKPSSLNSDDF